MSNNPDTLRIYAAIFEKRIAQDSNPLFPQAAPPGHYRDANPIDVAAAKALRFMADHIEKVGEEVASRAGEVVSSFAQHCLDFGDSSQ